MSDTAPTMKSLGPCCMPAPIECSIIGVAGPPLSVDDCDLEGNLPEGGECFTYEPRCEACNRPIAEGELRAIVLATGAP